MKNESLKQKQISQKIIPPVAKNRKIHMNTEKENATVDFNALNHPEKVSINTAQVMALNEKRNFSQILVIMTHRALTFPRNIFAVL